MNRKNREEIEALLCLLAEWELMEFDLIKQDRWKADQEKALHCIR